MPAGGSFDPTLRSSLDLVGVDGRFVDGPSAYSVRQDMLSAGDAAGHKVPLGDRF